MLKDSGIGKHNTWGVSQKGTAFAQHTPNFLKEYLTQNVIFHVKSNVTKYEF